MNNMRIRKLQNNGDNRGSSFCLPEESLNFIEELHNFHMATIKPEAIRGNHYHEQAKEYIIILHEDEWTLAYDHGKHSKTKIKKIDGSGAIAIEIKENITHAIKNTGKSDLTIVAFTNKILDPKNPDVVRNKIIE